MAAQKARRVTEYEESPKRCRGCGVPISYDKRNQNVFCSSSCSARVSNVGRVQSEKSKLAIAAALRGRRVGNARERIAREIRTCKACPKQFIVRTSSTQMCCSHECSNRAPGRIRGSGGVREGSGRSKTGRYGGIYCGSTWELAYLVKSLDDGLDIVRCRDRFMLPNGRWYLPDFVVAGTIIEIKGYVIDEAVQADKVHAVISAGRNITVLRKEQMLPYLEYAKKKFGPKLENGYDIGEVG